MADSGQVKQYYILAFIVFIERKWVFGFVSFSMCCITKSVLCMCMYVFFWLEVSGYLYDVLNLYRKNLQTVHLSLGGDNMIR